MHHDAAYFEAMYDSDDDPWGFDRRWYERRKFELTVAALPNERYRRAFEPGCANGTLTELLQARCDRLIASEMLEEVASRARGRLAHLDHVEVVVAAFPAWWPDGPLDLVVLSEVAYYLTDRGRDVAASSLLESLAPGGHVVAVHYTGTTDYPMTGVQVGDWLDRLDGLTCCVRHHDRSFELGVWTRTN